MREESHLDDMRDAIRGDFERLAERRGDQELMRVSEVEDDATAEETAPDGASDLVPVHAVESQPDPEPATVFPPELERDPQEEPEPEPAEPEPDRGRSWFARLFSA